LWSGVRHGVSAVRQLSRFDASLFRARLAAEIDDAALGVERFLEPKRARRLDRYSTFAVIASLQAVADAGLVDLEAAGCYVGSALGGVAFGELQHDLYLEKGLSAVNPALALSVFGGAAPANVAIELGLHGPCLANANSCASGAVAIGEAFRLIREGTCQVMLAGGAEAPLAPLTFGAFAVIKAMSTSAADPATASRPFDRSRDGFVMGEGAAMLVLESLSHAERRGAQVYAEVVGYAMTNDGYHMLAPLPSGEHAARCMCLALDDAGLVPGDVEYVNAHASATPIGDRAEARAIDSVFGAQVPVSGTKGLYGHPLGASGAIEMAITALAMRDGWLPGTTNFAEADEDNPLCLIGPPGLARQVGVSVNNAFGFGGINAALVLRRWPPDP
jgi:3-oxoacyl-[acyl-carrier-protein] synthase II